MIRFYDRKTRPGGGLVDAAGNHSAQAHNKCGARPQGEMEMNSEVFRIAKEAASRFTEDKRREVVKETAARIYNREITYKRGVHCILRTFPETIEGLAERMLDAALLKLEEAVYTTEKTEQAAGEAAGQFAGGRLGYRDAVHYILTSLPPTRLRLFPLNSEKYAEELLNEELSATNVNKE